MDAAESRPGADEAPGAGAEAPVEEIVDAEVVEEAPADAEAVAEAAESSVGADEEPAPGDDALAVAQRERDEYLDLAQRTRADFENFKRRAATQASDAEQRGRATIARNLLPAIDNLQRALAAAGTADGDGDGDGAEGLAKGFALVHDELRSALERSGVKAFDPAGSKFDPALHEAISTAPAEGVEPGTVVETLELGYRVDEQVIRPARVVVSG